MVIYLPEVDNRGQREMMVGGLLTGSVSMETLHPHSAPPKAVLPSVNVHLSRRDREGKRRRREQEEQEEQPNRFSG